MQPWWYPNRSTLRVLNHLAAVPLEENSDILIRLRYLREDVIINTTSFQSSHAEDAY